MPETVYHYDIARAYPSLQSMGLSDTVMQNWPRPWHLHPPPGSWRLFIVSCPTREGETENTPGALVDLLRGLVDVGRLELDDVIRDVILHRDRWHVRGWRRAPSPEEET